MIFWPEGAAEATLFGENLVRSGKWESRDLGSNLKVNSN